MNVTYLIPCLRVNGLTPQVEWISPSSKCGQDKRQKKKSCGFLVFAKWTSCLWDGCLDIRSPYASKSFAFDCRYHAKWDVDCQSRRIVTWGRLSGSLVRCVSVPSRARLPPWFHISRRRYVPTVPKSSCCWRASVSGGGQNLLRAALQIQADTSSRGSSLSMQRRRRRFWGLSGVCVGAWRQFSFWCVEDGRGPARECTWQEQHALVEKMSAPKPSFFVNRYPVGNANAKPQLRFRALMFSISLIGTAGSVPCGACVLGREAFSLQWMLTL